MIKTITSPKYARMIGWLIANRQARGMSIRALAEALGITTTAVHRVESLERRLDVFEYVQFCHALDVDPAEGIRMLK
ncbi:helix-turn-helix domain-containing protein [Thalassolituus marinus]|uniref:Helix-turn-helix transcriptional regulator n=1 Tax=Thalassolituus marinus TaxID=671053 RepID=A0ABS7ZQ83_9GAMM|nr:helix-turn-helix transcriptional regulator [Thalassolituus marinus]MCA6063774.1 helix-turn-helix transcriptional regulator [Thalassolituus marinus]